MTLNYFELDAIMLECLGNFRVEEGGGNTLHYLVTVGLREREGGGILILD